MELNKQGIPNDYTCPRRWYIGPQKKKIELLKAIDANRARYKETQQRVYFCRELIIYKSSNIKSLNNYHIGWLICPK